MTCLTWLYQTIPQASWVARLEGGRFEIQLAACSYAFIVDGEAGNAVRWHPARSLKDAQERCEALYCSADDQSSGRTVAVRPTLLQHHGAAARQ